MTRIRGLVVLSVLFAWVAPSVAQDQLSVRCATKEPGEREQLRLEASFSQLPPHLFAPATINVYVHVIDKSPADANAAPSPSQIDDQLAVLNSAFSQSGFTFVLKAVDRATNGYWHTMSPRSPEEKAAKAALHRGRSVDLNLYFADIGDGLLGWATFPWELAEEPSQDGVSLNISAMPGGSAASYDLGRTAVHQVGHWLGLYHTFQGRCNEQRGDFVLDTPAERSPAYGCQVDRNSCPNRAGADPVTNFMDYSSDLCVDSFTAGQLLRMRGMWTGYRLIQ